MKKHLLVAGALLAVACVCFAQSGPQSLAEVAKQKKAGKKAVLVLSDENLPSSSTPADTAEDQSSAPAAAGASEPGNKAEPGTAEATQNPDKKDADAPVSKDQRTNELKQKLASYQEQRDVWKNSAKHYEDLLANESSDFRRQAYLDALENDKHNAALYQQKIDEIQSELSRQESSQPSGHSDDAKKPGPGSQP